jgi:hypothetical protein
MVRVLFVSPEINPFASFRSTASMQPCCLRPTAGVAKNPTAKRLRTIRLDGLGAAVSLALPDIGIADALPGVLRDIWQVTPIIFDERRAGCGP